MNKVFKDDLQKEKRSLSTTVSAMYICLKSKHVTQSSLCTAKFFILFFSEYTYLLIFTVSYVLLIYSISIDFIFVIMSTNICRHIFTALSYTAPSVDIQCLLNASQTENNLDRGSVFFFVLPNSQQSPPKKQNAQFWVSSFTVFWSSSVSYIMILFVFFHHWSGKGWIVPVDSHEPLIQASVWPHSCKKKKKNWDCTGFHRFLREITEPQQVVPPHSGILRLCRSRLAPLEVTCWVCKSCFFVVSFWLFHGRYGYWFFSWFWNKALERFLVFTGAQRRPGRGRSSGGGEARCGRPWGSRESEPVRSPRRCLWWTDGPCSSWLL